MPEGDGGFAPRAEQVAADLKGIFGEQRGEARLHNVATAVRPNDRKRSRARWIWLALGLGVLFVGLAILFIRSSPGRAQAEAVRQGGSLNSSSPAPTGDRGQAPSTVLRLETDVDTPQNQLATPVAAGRVPAGQPSPSAANGLRQVGASLDPRVAQPDRARPQPATKAADPRVNRTAPGALSAVVAPDPCRLVEGAEQRAWCLRPRILAAHQQLRVDYQNALSSGVNAKDLKALQRRWTRLQQGASANPYDTISGYEDLRETLSDLTRERRSRTVG